MQAFREKLGRNVCIGIELVIIFIRMDENKSRQEMRCCDSAVYCFNYFMINFQMSWVSK